MIIHCFILFSSLFISFQKSINFTISHLFLEPYLQVNLGTPPQSLKLYPVSFGTFLYLNKHKGFNAQISSSYSLIKAFVPFELQNLFISGDLCSDLLQFDRTALTSFPFVLLNSTKISFSFNGTIGLGPTPERNALIEDLHPYSLMNQLIDSNLIDHFIMSIYPKDNSHTLSLGDFPREMFRDPPKRKLMRRCNLIKLSNKDNPRWECLLHSVYLSDGSMLRVNKRLAIMIEGKSIVISEEVFNFIVSKYFQDDFDNHLCFRKITHDNTFVICNEGYDARNRMIAFVMGKWSLKIPLQKLFTPILYEPNFQQMFVIIGKRGMLNQWEMGYNVIQAYLVVFDKDKGRIGFFEVKPSS